MKKLESRWVEIRPPITRFGRVLDTAFYGDYLVCITSEGSFMAKSVVSPLAWKKIVVTSDDMHLTKRHLSRRLLYTKRGNYSIDM